MQSTASNSGPKRSGSSPSGNSSRTAAPVAARRSRGPSGHRRAASVAVTRKPRRCSDRASKPTPHAASSTEARSGGRGWRPGPGPGSTRPRSRRASDTGSPTPRMGQRRAAGDPEDLGLLGRELLVGEDALGVQVSDLLSSSTFAATARRGAGGVPVDRLLGRLLLVLGLFLLGPLVVLPAGDPSGHGRGRTRDDGGRATPRTRPPRRIMVVVSSALVGGVELVERRDDGLDRNAAEATSWPPAWRTATANGAAQQVLVEQEDAGGVGVEDRGGLGHVVLPQHADRTPSKTVRSSSPSPSMSASSRMVSAPSASLLTRTRSMMRIRPRSTRSSRYRRPRRSAAGELDEDPVDRTHFLDVVSHVALLLGTVPGLRFQRRAGPVSPSPAGVIADPRGGEPLAAGSASGSADSRHGLRGDRHRSSRSSRPCRAAGFEVLCTEAVTPGSGGGSRTRRLCRGWCALLGDLGVSIEGLHRVEPSD